MVVELYNHVLYNHVYNHVYITISSLGLLNVTYIIYYIYTNTFMEIDSLT